TTRSALRAVYSPTTSAYKAVAIATANNPCRIRARTASRYVLNAITSTLATYPVVVRRARTMQKTRTWVATRRRRELVPKLGAPAAQSSAGAASTDASPASASSSGAASSTMGSLVGRVTVLGSNGGASSFSTTYGTCPWSQSSHPPPRGAPVASKHERSEEHT